MKKNNHDNMQILWDWLKFIWVLPLIGWFIVKKLDFGKASEFANFIYGTTAPLLTFISFLAVVFTLKTQKEQIQETRKDVERQNKTLSIQRFENTFFQMVNLHNDIVNSIIYEPSNLRGRSTFIRISSHLKTIYINYKNKDIEQFNQKDEISKVRIAYKRFFEHNEDQLGHYFRNLYRILKFIDETDTKIITSEEKKNYIGIIRAQLSSYELSVLLYNSLSIDGYNFLLLADTFNLFDNLNKDLLILPGHFGIFKNQASLYNTKSH